MAKTASGARAKTEAPKAKPAKTKPAKSSPRRPRVAEVAVPPAEGPWSVPLTTYALHGFAFGMGYPSVVFQCALPATTREERAVLERRFEALLEEVKNLHPLAPFADPAAGSEREDTEEWFAALAARLQLLANLPVFATPRSMGRTAKTIALQIPVLARGVQPTIDLLNLICAAFALDDERRLASLRERAQVAFTALKASALTTSNTPRLVKAAVESGIAFQELPGSMVQFGIGRNSMLMDSTFTHECSNVGARLAKHKHLSTAFLRRAGLPAPANAVVQSEEQALQIAAQLGFPVVVKPADKDGGVAVQADLRTEHEVRWAFEGARKVSKQVLVEKFYEGHDYRIVVFRGKAIWAKERQPPGVTGDGKSTVRALVEAINADPRRGSDVYAALKKIKLDEEAEKLLARDGLTFDSVPKKGEFVRLRRRANISAGGMPVAVTDKMHPDNARLAERAADLIGLDLAGVDLIIPDIARSWREVPSAICEINAQPELGGDAEHLYPQVLKALVRGTGHIPTIAVIGGSKADEVTAGLAAALGARGLCVGCHDRTGVHVGNETVLSGDQQVLRAGRILTMDRRVEVLVLGALDASVLRQGLPVQRIDVMLLTGDALPHPEFAKGAGDRFVAETLRLIAPHCRSVVALAPAEDFDPPLRAAVGKQLKLKRIVGPSERAAFLGGLVKTIVASARRGEGPASA